jgi:DNA invertase Pin-like site-specific DNA recombinase
MSCIAYINGEGEFSSQQMKELLLYSNHFELHISPWVFDKNEERKNLRELVINPQLHEMKTFLTTSFSNLGKSNIDSFNILDSFIEKNIHIICLAENIDTSSDVGVEIYEDFRESQL